MIYEIDAITLCEIMAFLSVRAVREISEYEKLGLTWMTWRAVSIESLVHSLKSDVVLLH